MNRSYFAILVGVLGHFFAHTFFFPLEAPSPSRLDRRILVRQKPWRFQRLPLVLEVLGEEAGYFAVAGYSVVEFDYVMSLILKHQVIYGHSA